MDQLQKLQADFAGAVFGGEEQAISDLIHAGNLDAHRRLRIYRNNVFRSLSQALADVYPVIKRLVGDDFFDHLAQQYICAHPSRSGNLHDFGQALPRFLRDFEPTQALVYLPDVARLEWAYHQAFHAADAGGINIEALASIAVTHAETLRFDFNPAAQLIASDYPILQIWQANQDGYDGDDIISLDDTGVRLLVNRIDYEIQFSRLSQGGYVLLEQLSENAAFACACEAALKVEPQLNLAESLFHFIQQRVLVDYSIA